MRYLARRGVEGWMVWDRNTHSPATINGKHAVKFSEEDAREHADAMNSVRLFPMQQTASESPSSK
jgi:hypothetical protein